MKHLSSEQIDIKEMNDGIHIIASLFENEGWRNYEIYHISELPNDLISLNDLKRFGINEIHMQSIARKEAF